LPAGKNSSAAQVLLLGCLSAGPNRQVGQIKRGFGIGSDIAFDAFALLATQTGLRLAQHVIQCDASVQAANFLPHAVCAQ
jgi:hypothetical protein